jgi:hypothetical protein
MIDEYEYKRALILLDKKVTVHASKKDGYFSNGILVEVSQEHFIIRDKVDGNEKLILFEELKKPLELFTKEENRNDL